MWCRSKYEWTQHVAIGKLFSHSEILEFVMPVGNYAMLAGALNSFGVPIERAWQ